jgi:hypothetical protein
LPDLSFYDDASSLPQLLYHLLDLFVTIGVELLLVGRKLPQQPQELAGGYRRLNALYISDRWPIA